MTKVLFSAVCLILLSACANTLEGIGKDMEKMGESIQESVDKIGKD